MCKRVNVSIDIHERGCIVVGRFTVAGRDGRIVFQKKFTLKSYLKKEGGFFERLGVSGELGFGSPLEGALSNLFQMILEAVSQVVPSSSSHFPNNLRKASSRKWILQIIKGKKK